MDALDFRPLEHARTVSGRRHQAHAGKVFPEEKAAVIAAAPPADQGYALHHLYTKNWDTNGFAVAAGTGVDYKINNALAFRVASLEYSHSWTQDMNGINYQNGLQLTTGLVLRMGTW